MRSQPVDQPNPAAESPSWDDYRWLVEEGANVMWERASAHGHSVLQLASRLRRDGLSAVRTHLLLDQILLRGRARAKFSRTDEMFFTRRALEQATDDRIAAYKSARFGSGRSVVDLCCGIGGDLLSLAQRGPATGVERDPVVALLARKNLLAQGSASARVVNCDARIADLDAFDAWHSDPDRRVAGRRASQPEHYEPPAEWLQELIARHAHGALKLAPASDTRKPWLESAEREWIGHGRQCQQVVAWFGDLAKRPSQRVATVLATDGRGEPTAVRSIAEREVFEAVVASGIGRFVYEPHPAVLAAHLVRCLAVECRLSFFAPGVAYLTGDDCIEDAALSCFRVEAVMPYRTRRIKQFLSQRRAGRLEVKKRGVTLEPEAVRRELAVPGDHRMTLILTSIRRSTMAILAERVSGAQSNSA